MKTAWRLFLMIPAALLLVGCSSPTAPKYKSPPPNEEPPDPDPGTGFIAPEAPQLPVSFG